MNEKIKKDHLNFKHQGQEKDYQKKCVLCARKMKVKQKGGSSGGDLGVNMKENAKMNDKFGK